MISKLSFSQFRTQIQRLLPCMGISLVFLVLSLLLQNLHGTGWQILKNLCLIGLFVFSAGTLVVSLWNGVLEFYHSFYSPRAYLTRTLPMSRNQIFTAVFSSSLCSLLVSLVWCVLMVLAAFSSNEEAQGWLEAFRQPELNGFLFWFGLAFALQMVFYLLCAWVGILFGFDRQKDRIGFSVLFAVLAYFIGEGILIACAFGVFSAAGLDMDSIMLLSDFETLLRTIALLYLAAEALYTGLICWKLKKGMDVDS